MHVYAIAYSYLNAHVFMQQWKELLELLFESSVNTANAGSMASAGGPKTPPMESVLHYLATFFGKWGC